MANIGEVVVAVAFPLPKMDAVLLGFVRTVHKKITDEPQHDDLTDFVSEVFTR